MKKTVLWTVFSVSVEGASPRRCFREAEMESYFLRQLIIVPRTGALVIKGALRMKSIAYYDGAVGSPDELTVPFNDRSHFFGDGVYDATMGANGKVYLLEDHLDRFYSSAAAFGINVPLAREGLGELLTDLLGQVEGPCHFVYWQVTRGFDGVRAHNYHPDLPGKLWVLISPEALGDPQNRLKLITLEDRRFQYGFVKTLNLLPAVAYSQAAAEAGADEAVLHRDGVVTECAHSNISILKDGILYSHPNDELILRGIAKTHLIQACYRESVPVVERAFTLQQLAGADEAIVTSSSHFCSPVCEIDGQPIGGHDPETLALLRRSLCNEFQDYMGIDPAELFE